MQDRFSSREGSARRSIETRRGLNWRTILCRFRTRDRGDSYLRLINYCPYSISAPLPPTLDREGPTLLRPRYAWGLTSTPVEASRAPGLTLILICPFIVRLYYSHILSIFTFIVSLIRRTRVCRISLALYRCLCLTFSGLSLRM